MGPWALPLLHGCLGAWLLLKGGQLLTARTQSGSLEGGQRGSPPRTPNKPQEEKGLGGGQLSLTRQSPEHKPPCPGRGVAASPETLGPLYCTFGWRLNGTPTPPCSRAALSAPTQGPVGTNETIEVTAGPMVKVQVLPRSQSPCYCWH